MTITLEFYNLITLLVIVAFVCFLAGVVVESRRGSVSSSDYGGGKMSQFSATSTGSGQAESNSGGSWFVVVFGVGALLLVMFMSAI